MYVYGLALSIKLWLVSSISRLHKWNLSEPTVTLRAGCHVQRLSWSYVITAFCPYLLHCLKGLGLSRDPNRSAPPPGQVPWAQFMGRAGLRISCRSRGVCGTGFGSLRNCRIEALWRWGESGGLAVFLEGCHSRDMAIMTSQTHDLHHGLCGGGAGAGAARSWWGQGVGFH